MQYPLHPKWEGVWEIRGHSRYNGERMIIIISNKNECILTDPNNFDEFKLNPEPNNNLRAHWDFRSSGKAQRYYIGQLLDKRNYDEIEWSEMRKKRKTDKWIRVKMDPLQYLKKCKLQKRKQQNNKSNTKRIIRRKNDNKNDNNNNNNNIDHTKHPSLIQQRHRQNQYSHSSPILNQMTTKYVPKYKPNKNNDNIHEKNNENKNNNENKKNQQQINDPAIMNIGNASFNNNNNNNNNNNFESFNNGNDRFPKKQKYQTEHKPHKRNQYFVEYYPKPRRTVLRHDQIHEPRYPRDRKQYALRNKIYQVKGEKNDNKAAVLDAYLDTDRKERDRARYRDNRDNRNDRNDRNDRKRRERRRDRNGGNEEWKPKRERRRRSTKFSKHITKEETDRILAETKGFKNPILYIGGISLSRFNPNVAYVNVGLDRDIRISGFVDRNRAFHGDQVVISIYPEIEWMSAIKPEIQDFKNRLDERDTLAASKMINEEDIDEDEDDDINEVILDGFTGYNASSSSASSDDNNNNNNDDDEGDQVKNDNNDEIEDDDDAEIIYFDDSDSEKNKTNDDEERKEVKIDDVDDDDDDIKNDEEMIISEKKEKEKEKEDVEEKTNQIMFKKHRRMEELNDSSSITAYDQYLFLIENVNDFNRFCQKWPDLELTNKNHPRRDYIDKVIKKCGNKLPSEALLNFEWNNPSNHHDRIARGKVIGIYSAKPSNKEMIPGFLLPMIYNGRGQIDRRWALFTPSDKRYPKAQFPMRELPHSLNDLFYKFEKEEIEIIEEWENRKHDLRRQGYKYKEVERMVKRRNNKYNEELKLMFFNMSFECRWPDHYFMPICHLKQELGKRGAVDVETNVILSRHNISWRQSFSKEIEDFVANFKITEKDYIGRRDCRSLRVFSIDPTSARDFDDALSIQQLHGELDENGKKIYQIGIHIADVTHFVKPGSIVDLEAKHRATSVYLVDRCLPMLPHHLCQNLCSLNPDVDRLAYSVFVILNEEGHLVHRKGDKYDKSPWFGRSVIRSRARLNYETAHWMLIDKITGDTALNKLDECCVISSDTTLSDIVNDTKLFWSIAKQMRERRFANGSVQFFRPHIRFRLDKKDKHRALVFGPEILLWSNNLIEEMMLLANQLVANQLISKIKTHTLLRKHPHPLQEKGMKLQLICRSQNMELKYDTPKHLNESLIEMSKKTYGGINAAQIINALLAQAMMRASYIIVEDQAATEWTHWALNFPIYTHFTSPIRRYADVLVHRLLTYSLSMDDEDENEDDDLKQKLPSINDMKLQCAICNDRNAAAHFAEIDSQTIHLCLVLIDRPIIVDAMLIDLFKSYFILVVPGLGLDVRVNAGDCIKESKGTILSIEKQYELPDSKLIISWNNGQYEEYKLFDKMRIRLSSILKTPIKLVTAIIEPEKRKYLKPANSDVIIQDEQEQNNDDDDDDDDEHKTNNNDNNNNNNELPPVAMTLDSQLKVGTCDYYAAHYD